MSRRKISRHEKKHHSEEHHSEEHCDSAISIIEGVGDVPTVNPNYRRKRKSRLTTDQFVEGILNANIPILSQAITLIESSNSKHHKQAQEIIERCVPYSGNSIRVGITGVPGAGKSTFIEAIGGLVAEMGHKLAVLAIDPSSSISKGSILGDKTRMATISSNPNIFIRPSPSAGSLGGVARKTRESVILCEAAGFDVSFIETVGVGQSEVAVHSMVDMFMMLQISGAGDELQGIKRGIMEMANIAVITKADGDNVTNAELTKRAFLNALMLFPLGESEWSPEVFTCSSKQKIGLREIWENVEQYMAHIKSNGYFKLNRQGQNRYWMYETIEQTLMESFFSNPNIEKLIRQYEQAVLENKTSSFTAARDLLDIYFHTVKRGK